MSTVQKTQISLGDFTLQVEWHEHKPEGSNPDHFFHLMWNIGYITSTGSNEELVFFVNGEYHHHDVKYPTLAAAQHALQQKLRLHLRDVLTRALKDFADPDGVNEES